MLDRTALSRNLEPLAAQGHVRIVAGTDARTREISLTRAGEAALARALPHWRHAQAQVARQLGEQKNAALIGLLADVEKLHPAPRQHPE
jgi:DNA-binding MarR family transcriptional regulator